MPLGKASKITLDCRIGFLYQCALEGGYAAYPFDKLRVIGLVTADSHSMLMIIICSEPLGKLERAVLNQMVNYRY